MLLRLLRQLARRPGSPAPVGNPAESAAASESAHSAARLLAARDYAGLHELCRGQLALRPDDGDALMFLASALSGLDRTAEAIDAMQRAIVASPNSAAFRAMAARLLLRAGRIPDAVSAYRAALACPDASKLRAEFAALLNRLGDYDEAEQVARGAPESGAAGRELGRALFEQGRVAEAIALLRGLAATAGIDAATHSDLLRALNYCYTTTTAEVFREHVAWAARHADPLSATAVAHPNEPDPDRKLRLALVSPHFRKHPVSFFLESVLRELDGDQVAVTLYSDAVQCDEYSERLRNASTAWRDTADMDDDALAACVRSDAIDILVDLSGHTPGNRLLAFARCPAPVQVAWNGYPNTTGMRTLGYRITDARCDPPGTTEQLHTERLLRLPDVYMSWTPPLASPPEGALPLRSNGYVTFASFNACYKLSDTTLALWCRILRALPSARLLLAAVPAGKAQARLRGYFEGAGIDASRLDFRARTDHESFLALHQEADIALDPFPYHGTTTTCFTLWMGVPVVTLAGSTHVSRVGVTLLSQVGLERLVAKDADEYVRIACELAADELALARLRAAMRERIAQSPLVDGKRCARALEGAIRQAWAEWCSGKSRSSTRQRPAAQANPEPTTARYPNVITQSDYGPLIVNRFDNMVGRCISRYGHWEKDEVDLLQWLLPVCYPGERDIVILDVGAYVGFQTLGFARFPIEGLTVHAFEPQRLVFQMLAGTVALNSLTNVYLHHKAVSDRTGHTIRYPCVDYAQEANFGSLELEAAHKPDFDGRTVEGAWESVETVCLDDLALGKVRLIKLDIEGMEHKALLGARRTLRECRPLIFLEHEKTDFSAVKALLKSLGYVSYYAQRPNILCVPGEIEHLELKGAVKVES